MTPDEEAQIDWSLTTWKGNRLQQHREFQALSFRQKLQVIEEMADFSRATMELRSKQGLAYIDPDTGQRMPSAAIVREEPPKA